MADVKFDLIVIGDGITGLSTGYHLLQKGIKRFAVFGRKNADTSATWRSPGIATGGQTDNYTRLTHAFGDDLAKSLWAFGLRGFAGLKRYHEESGVPFAAKRRVRLVVAQDELIEAREATRELNLAGFQAALFEPRGKSAFGDTTKDRVLAIQDEGETAGLTSPPLLWKSLQRKLGDRYQRQDVTSVKVNPKSVTLRTSEGATFEAEVVVLATHLGIAKFLPELEEALVAVADQWVEFKGAGASGVWQDPGAVFSAMHGYEWGATAAGGKVFVGGGRFLRHLAGIGASEALVEERVTKFLMNKLKETFTWGDGVKAGGATAFLDCRPCDELPIIGPMYGQPRLLLGVGYSGTGLTMGFEAGKCLADLIQSGRCDDLPRRLWPERLRSMS